MIRERAAAGVPVIALAVVACLAAACFGDRPAATAGPVAPATPGPALSGTPSIFASPVVGALVGLESEGLTRVIGFRLRTDDGSELAFRLGVLENGAEFPPGHLAEHMSTSTRVRVFFRDEAGEHVVYRLEDAE